MTVATAVSFDADLMRRYDREGPRYTSYPTALQFHEGIGVDDYECAATTSRGALERHPLSLYVHIPFCFSPCFYCGCNKVVTRHLEHADSYVRYLLHEISQRGAFFDRGRVVEQMHFGGGTPTFLPKKLLTELVRRIGQEFRLTGEDNRDYSIEIDPRGADKEMLQLLASLGFNRISLGVQDFDETVQLAVNRLQPAETVARVHDAARELGFRSINFDLIYGLPKQTVESFGATLDRVAAMRPDRLAVYGYAHMPHVFKAQRQIRSAELPDAAARLALLQLAIDKLGSAGYTYIGMDHFALPTDSLALAQQNGSLHRSFQGYTTHANRDLVNLGVSAIGQVGNLYVQNYKSLQDYQGTIARGSLPSHRGVRMTKDDWLRKDVIHKIMCYGGVDMATVEHRHGVRFEEHFAAELERLHALATDGLVHLNDRRIDLTPAGRLLMRTVATAFDAYAAAPRAARMSRMI
jgi:oxygen-independent coproporphyrinogen-3 oxidase